MIDRTYIILSFALAIMLFPDVTLGIIYVLTVLYSVWVLLFCARESLLWLFGSRPVRLLARLRWIEIYGASWLTRARRHKLAEQLIWHYQLEPGLEAIACLDSRSNGFIALEAMMEDVNRINRWSCPLIGRKLSRGFLAKVLVEVRPLPALKVSAVNAALSPNIPFLLRWSWRQRIVVAINGAISDLVFRQQMEAVLDIVQRGVFYLRTHVQQPGEEIWEKEYFKEFKLASHAYQLLDWANLRWDASEIRYLPLGSLRLLLSIWQVLYKDGETAYRIALLLNPRHLQILRKLREERVVHDQWLEEKRAQSVLARHMGVAKKKALEDKLATLADLPIEKIMAERRMPAILLARSWPIGVPAPGRSYLGGLPCLPAHTQWPRRRELAWPRSRDVGPPLHFLAQIDCRELPDLDGASSLPRDGDLLFFADIDEEMQWRDSATSRVVFIPASERTDEERPLPSDMPHLGWSHQDPKMGWSETSRYQYPKWPVSAHSFETYVIKPLAAGAGIEDITSAQHNVLRGAMEKQANRILPRGDVPLFPTLIRKDPVIDPETGKVRRNAEGAAEYRGSFNPEPLGTGFPYCGAVINSFFVTLRATARGAIRYGERKAIELHGREGHIDEEQLARYRAEIHVMRDLLLQIDELAARLGPLAEDVPTGERERAILIRWVEELVALEAAHGKALRLSRLVAFRSSGIELYSRSIGSKFGFADGRGNILRHCKAASAAIAPFYTPHAWGTL